MNNYFKGIASLLDIYATQKTEPDLKHPSWDDFSALKSDWEKISDDLKISILKYTSEIASANDSLFVENMFKTVEEYLNNLDTINKILSELEQKPKNMPIHNTQSVNSFHRNITSQKEFLEKMNQSLGDNRPNVKAKESK